MARTRRRDASGRTSRGIAVEASTTSAGASTPVNRGEERRRPSSTVRSSVSSTIRVRDLTSSGGAKRPTRRRCRQARGLARRCTGGCMVGAKACVQLTSPSSRSPCESVCSMYSVAIRGLRRWSRPVVTHLRAGLPPPSGTGRGSRSLSAGATSLSTTWSARRYCWSAGRY